MVRFQEEARKALPVTIAEIIQEFKRSWITNIGARFKSLNAAIISAQNFEISKVAVVSDEEISQHTVTLTNLLNLKMSEQIQELVMELLREKGLEDEFVAEIEAKLNTRK